MNKSFKDLQTLSKNFTKNEVCIKYLQNIVWANGVHCPECGSDRVYHFKDGNRKKCKENKCYTQFNVLTGTFMQSTKIPVCKWFHAIYLFTSLKKGVSSHALGRLISVQQRTAWYMLTRIRAMMQAKGKLSGFVQIDETYIGGNISNRHKKDRKYNRDKEGVMGMVEKGGNVIFTPINNRPIKEAIYKHVKLQSHITTDGFLAYHGLDRDYTHSTVQHNIEEFVNEEGYHTNSVEGMFSHLKRGIYGVYHHVSRQHLHRYCNEFAFRLSTRKYSESDRFDLAIKQFYGSIRYYEVIGLRQRPVRKPKFTVSKLYKPDLKPFTKNIGKDMGMI